jgi:DNA primase
VLDFYGWKAKRCGTEIESCACPQRADHSRRAFVINANTGRWQCFPCGTSGDLFDFIEAVEGLSDFPSVVAKAAAIAGVTDAIDPEERARRRRERILVDEREREEKLARERAAIPRASYHWSSLLPRHEAGEAYLEERGCAAAIEAHIVRFEADGSPALPLFNSDGHIRNVVRRRLQGEPKTPGLPDCPTAGTLAHSVIDIEPGRDVVVTEGVFDSITAVVAWKSAIVLGAHGAGNLPKVVKVASRCAARAGTRLLLVPHQDRAGYERAKEAIAHAHTAGLSLHRGTLEIVKTGAKDLNDAWRNGWRPCA